MNDLVRRYDCPFDEPFGAGVVRQIEVDGKTLRHALLFTGREHVEMSEIDLMAKAKPYLDEWEALVRGAGK